MHSGGVSSNYLPLGNDFLPSAPSLVDLDNDGFPELPRTELKPLALIKSSWNMLNRDLVLFMLGFISISLTLQLFDLAIISLCSHSFGLMVTALVIFGFLRSVIGMCLSVGLCNAILQYARFPGSESIPRSEWTVGFSSQYFGKAIVLMVLQVILLVLGFLCFVLPGLYLGLAFSMSLPILVEFPHYSVFTILQKSMQVVNRQLIRFILFMLGLYLLQILGLLLLGIGIFPAMMVALVAVPLAYRETVGLQGIDFPALVPMESVV
jgi:hypothetical protein